ncbi:antitoxin CptB [Sphingorhabdus rigui]|uniref:FAD assembly factor SdhE n=1 Tax=Sphingorhabdus rigui TaxID=1282858 RepID=A0A840B128_9SPHN|nr:succinate dehydrogenase assembly factor 2 [Sphingorhabdus rigui]MBB3942917.1 antitoxin CptB [Sphingorhabdus rigui]
MDAAPYRRKLHYRAHHRGTREADAMVGGFFDQCSANWGEAEYEWFERLIEEEDVDIMAWALGTAPPDPAFAGPLMEQLMQLNFITLPEGLSTQTS